MAHIPISLPDQSIHIHAQRELAFQMVSALGISEEDRANGNSKKGPTIKVIAANGNRQLVEFRTPLKLGPLNTSWKTTEWVTPHSPVSIDFDLLPDSGLVAGGLRELHDRFDFEQAGNCTVLNYQSQFGIRWSVGGWLLGKLVFRPIIKKHMIQHLTEVKQLIENRARRSRIYPQLACSLDDSAIGEPNS